MLVHICLLTEWLEEAKDHGPSAKELQKEVDEYMKAYDERVEEVCVLLKFDFDNWIIAG